MEYTTKLINRNFRIKVSGVNGKGERLNTLVGVSGLLSLIGEKLANRLLVRAFNCMLDKCVCKLRRGLKITFYYK